jgi:hypothetical protein
MLVAEQLLVAAWRGSRGGCALNDATCRNAVISRLEAVQNSITGGEGLV